MSAECNGDLTGVHWKDKPAFGKTRTVERLLQIGTLGGGGIYKGSAVCPHPLERRSRQDLDIYVLSKIVLVSYSPWPPTSLPTLPLSLPVLFVDLVPKAHCAYDCELQPHIALLEVIGIRPKLDTWLCVGGWLPLELGVEQGVHEGGLAQTCLSWKAKE